MAATVAPAAAMANTAPTGQLGLVRIGFANFADQVGTTFRVRHATGSAKLKLFKATERPAAQRRNRQAPDAANEQFSLVFRGPRNQSLSQHSYSFEHPKLGTFAMLIVPVIARDREHHYYEAVFNRPAARAERLG